MELWQVGIPFADGADRVALMRLLETLQVPMDPCAGDPRLAMDAQGRQVLLVIVTQRMHDQLRAAGRAFEVVRDFRDVPDPIRYVSPKNRYADALARFRAGKPRR